MWLLDEDKKEDVNDIVDNEETNNDIVDEDKKEENIEEKDWVYEDAEVDEFDNWQPTGNKVKVRRLVSKSRMIDTINDKVLDIKYKLILWTATEDEVRLLSQLSW